jgi:hypothetical protein
MMLRAVMFTLLLALPSWGAGQLEVLRSSARSARASVSEIRSTQLAQRSDLSALSARIEELKGQSRGKLLRRGELDAALKQSQQLSESLSGLAQQLSLREAESGAAQRSLVDALSSELLLVRRQFDAESDREKRRSLIERMKSLRAERDAIVATLPASQVPTLEPLNATDDPEVLLEQADLLRDREEKIRRELKTLEKRIAERHEEVEMNRRVDRFMSEEAMFDDQDRRLRLQKTIGAQTLEAPRAAAAREDDTATTGPAAAPQGSFGAAEGAAAPKNGADATQPRVVTGADARPQLGQRGGFNDVDGDLSALTNQKKTLEGFAETLKQKALELERRASER